MPSCNVAMSDSLADTLPDNAPIADVLPDMFTSCASCEASTSSLVYVVALSALSNNLASISVLL